MKSESTDDEVKYFLFWSKERGFYTAEIRQGNKSFNDWISNRKNVTSAQAAMMVACGLVDVGEFTKAKFRVLRANE